MISRSWELAYSRTKVVGSCGLVGARRAYMDGVKDFVGGFTYIW